MSVSFVGLLVYLLCLAAILGALYLVIKWAVLAALTEHAERMARRGPAAGPPWPGAGT